MLDGDEQQSSPSEPDAAKPAAVNAPTLLVIDDDTVHRMIICKVANRAGFAVTGAATYDEAVKLLGEHEYAAISLDLSLGQRGGVDVLHYLAAMDCEAPIIIVSGSGETIRSETLSVAYLLNINVCEALPKPVNLGQLRRILVDLKDRRAVGLAPCRKAAL